MRSKNMGFSLFLFFALFNFLLFSQESIKIENLKFKDTDIKTVIRALFENTGKSVVFSPEVEGAITIQLKNVDLETALKAILRPYGYGWDKIGENVIFIDTIENLTQQKAKLREKEEEEALEMRTFSLSSAKAEEIKPIIESSLTPLGKISYDTRTNVLVVSDKPSTLDQIEKIIRELDKMTPQVLIEAKIVETDLDITNKLGISWNIEGSVSGSRRAHTWPFTTHSSNKYLRDTDIPAVSSVHSTLSDVFRYGTLNASELSATLDIIFNDTNTKILSTPSITTQDNNTATINVVTKDPVPNYTYNTDNNAWEISGFEYVEYGVVLEVTPQIHKGGFITLLVKPEVSENLGDKEFTSGSGATAEIPVLYTQTTSTRVTVKNGETLVIGGLVRDKTVDTVNKIPILGDIPLLGYLFKHKNKTVEKKNLLIFITPKIIKFQEEGVSEENLTVEKKEAALPKK